MFQKSTEFRSEILQVFRERNYGRDGLMVMQVVQYWDGKKKLGTAKLVNQEHYVDKDGVRKPGKMKGFSVEDCRYIAENIDAITHVLELGIPWKDPRTEKVTITGANYQAQDQLQFSDDEIPF